MASIFEVVAQLVKIRHEEISRRIVFIEFISAKVSKVSFFNDYLGFFAELYQSIFA
jgi:hypothetical protein